MEEGKSVRTMRRKRFSKVKKILATTVEIEIDNEDTVDNSLSLESFGLANFESTSDSEFETYIEYLSEEESYLDLSEI